MLRVTLGAPTELSKGSGGAPNYQCNLLILYNIIDIMSYQRELRGRTERFGLISPRQCNLLTIFIIIL